MAEAGKVEPGAIFVLFENSLLAQGLELLLGQQGLKAIRVDLKQTGAWEKINGSLQAGDIVIVDKRDSHVHPRRSIMQLFLNKPEITILGLDPSDNKLELNKKHLTPVNSPEELAQLIYSCWLGRQTSHDQL